VKLFTAVVLIRTIIFYVLTMASVRLMGKRQIGELEPSELVITIIISELATIPMQDAEYPLINIAVSIFALAAIEIFSAAISLKCRKVGEIISGKYSIIVDNGVINQEEMKKNQLTLGELYEELRQNGALDLSDVKFCILETSGKMSVILKKDAVQNSIPYPLIADGQPIKENILKYGKTQAEIMKEAKKHGIKDIKDVFLCVNNDGTLEWTKKDKKT